MASTLHPIIGGQQMCRPVKKKSYSDSQLDVQKTRSESNNVSLATAVAITWNNLPLTLQPQRAIFSFNSKLKTPCIVAYT